MYTLYSLNTEGTKAAAGNPPQELEVKWPKAENLPVFQIQIYVLSSVCMLKEKLPIIRHWWEEKQ